MSIQNSLNSITASVAGAVAAGKYASDKKEAKAEHETEKEAIGQEQGLLAKEQFHEAKASLSELEGQSKEAEKTLKEKTAISDALANKKPGGKGNTKKALEEKRAAALTDTEAAKRAFDELGDKMEAKRAMMLRAQMIMKRTGIIGE